MTLIKRMVSAQTRMDMNVESIDGKLSLMRVEEALMDIRKALANRDDRASEFSFLLPDDVHEMLLAADDEVGSKNGKLELPIEASGKHAGAAKIVETLHEAGIRDLTLSTRYGCGCIDGHPAPEAFRFT